MCAAHYEKHRKYGDATAGYRRRPNRAGCVRPDGYLVVNDKLEHIRVAESVLGKPLPIGAMVHHIDENRLNNARDNLVICPSQTYHMLLHARMRALAACGHADWRKCIYCKQWDAPNNLKIRQRGGTHHLSCRAIYRRNHK